MHINQTRIFRHWKTFWSNPSVRCVWRQIETIHGHKSEKINHKKPSQNDEQYSFHKLFQFTHLSSSA